MRTVQRLGAYLAVFSILFVGFAASRLWAPIDHRQFELQSSLLRGETEVPLTNKILLVDLPRFVTADDQTDPSGFRLRLAALLDRVGGATPLPRAVILDVAVGASAGGLDALTASVRRLGDQGVEVWAVLSPETLGRVDAEAVWQRHARSFYDALDGRYGHTANNLYRGVLSYPTEIEMQLEGGLIQSLPALAVAAASELSGSTAALPSGSLVVAVGNEAAIDAETFLFDADVPGGPFVRDGSPEAPSFDDMIVVVGSLAADRDLDASQAGPKLFVWALNDRLAGGAGFYQPENRPVVILALGLLFAGLTALAYALLFYAVKPLQTRPLVIAILAVALSALALGGLAFAVFMNNQIARVGLPLFAIVLTGVLAWRYAIVFLVTGVAEGTGRYDAFISYSRKHGDWVTEHLYEPLKALRKRDGGAVVIFFDRDSIGIGEAFTPKYMRAIVDSKVFIPVFSEDYYGKNHCRNEMDLAYKRAMDGKLTVLPIARSEGAVPDIYSHLNYVDAGVRPEFFEDVGEAVLGVVGDEGARAEGAPDS